MLSCEYCKVFDSKPLVVSVNLLFVTFLFILENSQNSFSCGSPFGLFWSVKYLNFEQKLLIWTVHIFLESRHLEVTKNPYYVLSPKGSQKKVSAYGQIPVCRGVYIHYFKINPPLSAVLSFLKIISTLRSGSTK